MYSEKTQFDIERIYPLLTEPYAFAALLWPAVISVFLLPGDDMAIWRYALYVWLAIWHLAAYRRAAGFGNVVLFNSTVVASACYGYPSAWTLAWLPVLLVGLLAAQRASLKNAGSARCEDAPGSDVLAE